MDTHDHLKNLQTPRSGSPELFLTTPIEAEAGRLPHPPESDENLSESRMSSAPAEFSSLGTGESLTRKAASIDLLLDVSLPVSIELGRTRRTIAEILDLGTGSIIELDKLAGEPVDILVNNKPVAKGEVVVLDENFGVRITSLVSPGERLERLKS